MKKWLKRLWRSFRIELHFWVCDWCSNAHMGHYCKDMDKI